MTQDRKIKVRPVERVVEYKKPPRPVCGYYILTTVLSTLIFLLLYLLVIIPTYTGFFQVIGVFLANLISGIVGSMMARGLTAYFEGILKNAQEISRNMISAVISTLIVLIGLYGFIMDRYIDPSSISLIDFLAYMVSTPFLELMLVVAIMRGFVYLLADFIADKMSF